ncbi:MAG: arsenate reductase (azurin) small subunit [Nitrospirales bacterium]|nr:arsenate reductase (azurin) small subunit [Nitrospirales bacterium]
MSDLSRRHFLKLGACLAGGACAGTVLPMAEASQEAKEASTLTTTLPYPRLKLVNISELEIRHEMRLTYPDVDSPISLIKFGTRILHGIGPEGDIVAFSRYCTHMGGHLQFKADTGAFHCPLHFAMFDAQKSGLMVIGQATDNLPQVELEMDDRGDIYAFGVKGLIYGRQANVLA